MALNNTFFPLIDLNSKQDPDPRIAKLALEAARRANELTGEKNPIVLDTLAVALYRTGDPAEAVAIEEKAIKQLEAQIAEQVAPVLQVLRRAAREVPQGGRREGRQGREAVTRSRRRPRSGCGMRAGTRLVRTPHPARAGVFLLSASPARRIAVWRRSASVSR